MHIQQSFKEKGAAGKLYLVPTPIGNLEDMTVRAVNTLKEVDVIAAEDTRNTGLLLKHFAIDTRQVSFHEHNAHEKIPYLLDLLTAGQSIAQVSDAGMPSISDPGQDLVRAAIARELTVVALPGPSAGITALIASGLAPQPHVFYGFLPRKTGQQRAFFEEKKTYPETQIFYESPHRLLSTLKNMQDVYGNRSVVLVRELTKLYEEYQRGSLSELVDSLTDRPVKGECLLIVEGAIEKKVETADASQIVSLVQEAVSTGKKPNQAIKEIAKRYGYSRQEVYQWYHDV